MLCPICRSAVCRRSKRRGWMDNSAAAILRMRPWRCRTCEARFYAWTVPVRFVTYVHCTHCGNLDVERTTRDRVIEGLFSGVFRALRVPAYRCDQCRHRFFSALRFQPIEATRVESLMEEPSAEPQPETPEHPAAE